MKRSDKEILEEIREKKKQQGISALSDAELMALLIKTGDKDKDVCTLCSFALKRAGGLGELSKMRPEELMAQNKGMSEAKAELAEVAFALGERAAKMHPKEFRFTSAAAVAAFVRPSFVGLVQEKFCVLLLDQGYSLIDRIDISVGTLNSAMVHMRDVFREAIRRNAYALVAVHNHIGLDPTPGSADRAMTQRLLQCGELVGVKVLDHIIVAQDAHYSFREEGRL